MNTKGKACQQLLADLEYVWEERKKNHQMERDLITKMKTGIDVEGSEETIPITWVDFAEFAFDEACRAFAHAVKCRSEEAYQMLGKACDLAEGVGIAADPNDAMLEVMEDSDE